MFSRFKNKEKHFYAWKHGDARNQNVNKKNASRISVDPLSPTLRNKLRKFGVDDYYFVSSIFT